MRLSCPTCRTGLQVPDGTTAHVRCPTCRTVFAPPELPPAASRPTARPRKPPEEPSVKRERKQPRAEDAENERPRQKTRPRRDDPESQLRREERTAFDRAAWGCRLIHWSLGLYALSLVLVILFFLVTVTAAGEVEGLLVAAGVVGLINWLMAGVGIGLCLSGPRSPGHLGYGIAAAVAAGIHFLLLIPLVASGHALAEFMNRPGAEGMTGWAHLPTKLVSVAAYLSWLAYPEDGAAPRHAVLSVAAGVFEQARLLLIVMLLSCLARAAGDEPLSSRCTRAAGAAVLVPAALAVAMLLFTLAMVETRAREATIGKVLLESFRMGAYAMLAVMLLPAMGVSRDTAEACDAPFQKEIDLAS